MGKHEALSPTTRVDFDQAETLAYHQAAALDEIAGRYASTSEAIVGYGRGEFDQTIGPLALRLILDKKIGDYDSNRSSGAHRAPYADQPPSAWAVSRNIPIL